MKALFKTSVKNLIYAALFITCSLSYGQQWSTPVIDGYGGIVYDPTTSVQPRKNFEYKLLYKITDDEKRNGVNRGLNGIAHALNMFGVSGVDLKDVRIVASVSGKATFDLLSDEAYMKKYGTKNPNTELIQLLTENNVKLYVCSQALYPRNLERDEINEHIVFALSASSVMSNYLMNGYVRM